MGYQPKVQPELKYPPGNPNAFCGECSAKIEAGMDKCSECGTSFPSRLPISPFTGEHYDPAWGTIVQKGGGREMIEQWNSQLLQNCSKPATLSHPHQPSWLVRLWHHLLYRWRMVCFSLRPGPYIEDMARQLEATTVGRRDSHVPLLLSGEQGTELFSAKMLTAGKVTMIEAINNMRAIHGYEPLPDEPQADHQEMQFAPSDWTGEMATIQVVFLKIDEQAETAQEQAQALCDEFDSGYGEYVDGAVSSLLKELYADIGKVGFIIRAFVKAPEPVVAQIKRQYHQAIPYRYVEGVQWEC